MPGNQKIAPNGFGRIGWLMAQTWPYMIGSYRHTASAMAKELTRMEIDATDEKSILQEMAFAPPLRFDPTDNPQVYAPHHLPDSVATDVIYDGPELPKERYWRRQFPKDYQKKRKAKRRQQKLSRRKR